MSEVRVKQKLFWQFEATSIKKYIFFNIIETISVLDIFRRRKKSSEKT